MSETAPNVPAAGKFKSAQWGVAEGELTNRQRWLCFWSLFVFGSCCVYQWLMPASILTNIGAVFNMDLDTAGWIMSVFTLTGLLLAYPGAWIMRNVGIKVSIIIAAVLTIMGNVLALLADSGTLFIFARAVQGCGFGLIAVIGPNIMPRLFPLERQGLVMGIWSQWVCPGVALASLSTPLLYAAFGWKSIFVLSLALQVVTTLLVLAFVKMPAVPENVRAKGQGKARMGKPSKAYTISAFAVGFCFLAWCTSYPTFNTFYPTYAQTVQGMDLFTASMTTLVAAVATIPGGILFGLVADKIKQRKFMLIAGYVLLIVVCATVLWSNSQNQALAWGSIIFLGFFCAGLVPTMSRALIPVLAQDPATTDYALTGMAFVTQLGGFIAAFFGTIAAGSTYQFAALTFVVPLCAAAVIVLLFVKNDHRMKRGEIASEGEAVQQAAS